MFSEQFQHHIKCFPDQLKKSLRNWTQKLLLSADVVTLIQGQGK